MEREFVSITDAGGWCSGLMLQEVMTTEPLTAGPATDHKRKETGEMKPVSDFLT